MRAAQRLRTSDQLPHYSRALVRAMAVLVNGLLADADGRVQCIERMTYCLGVLSVPVECGVESFFLISISN